MPRGDRFSIFPTMIYQIIWKAAASSDCQWRHLASETLCVSILITEDAPSRLGLQIHISERLLRVADR